MSKRKVMIYVSGTLPPDIVPTLSIRGWEPVIANDAVTAEAMIPTCNCYVGLVYFHEPNEEQLIEAEALLIQGGQMEWIALVTQHALSSTKLCKFIADFFCDYHTVPADPERLVESLGHAYGKARLRQPTCDTIESLGEYGMVGNGLAVRKLYQSLNKVCSTDAPVLLIGESGTGKELAAWAIHEHSPRAAGPFVPVNCGALPPHLIQSELFGHEKGAFTGADRRKFGRIESAAGGTIFLDEIGDLPLDLQVNLLRFLQEKTIERLGSNQRIPVDVRVVAATNVDLEKSVAEGRFRQDLYYRINVLHLRVPSLRERGADIELLANAYFHKFAKEGRHRARGFSRQALQVMKTYDWPGNIRELINRVRCAVVMCEKRLIMPEDLGLEQRADARVVMTLEDGRARAEENLVRTALYRNGNNASKAALELGISRATLYRIMERTRGMKRGNANLEG